MKKKITYLIFQEKVFPQKSPFVRKNFGIITNLIKYISLRFAYVLYRIGLTANALNLIGLIALIPAFAFTYKGLIDININSFLLGYSMLAIIIFIDFVDGPLSNAHDFEYKIGTNLDNLCPDIVLMGGLILVGLLTNNLYLIILSWINAVFFITYMASTIESISNNKWLLKLLASRFSLLSVRVFIAFLFPFLSLSYIYNQEIGQLLARTVVILYAVLSAIWISSTFEDKIKRDN